MLPKIDHLLVLVFCNAASEGIAQQLDKQADEFLLVRITSYNVCYTKLLRYEEMAKRALGAPWSTLSERDQQEFVSLFRNNFV